MRVLYQRVIWFPGLWCILVDKFATLGFQYADMVVSNPPLLLLILRLQFDDGAISKNPESVVAYKFRRFLFITAQVRAMNIDNSDFSPEVLQYVTGLLPKHRSTLLPGLRTANWLDDEYLIPSFLSSCLGASDSRASSPSPGNPDEPDGLIRVPPSPRFWIPFDTNAVRTLHLQMHTLVSPTDRAANYQLFLASIQQLQNQCRTVFPQLDRLMFLICRHKYHKPSMLSRMVANVIASFVLETDAVPLSASIPRPPSTLPFRQEHMQGGTFVEGMGINGYLSHAPVLNAAGETANGPAPPDAYPIVSAHLVTSNNGLALALACTTNMTPSSIEERHAFCSILSSASDFSGLETIVLHLDQISLRFSHGDLNFIAKTWKNLRTLDLRFKTVVTNEHLDIVQANSVQILTKPNSADRLKRIHLPALDLRNFRNLMKYRQDTLTTLTSCVLYVGDDEIKEVCVALLAAYPNLTTVSTGPGSDPRWSKVSQVLEAVREKRRAERSARQQRIRAEALFAHGQAHQ
ncbi:hypothetical protein GSI_13315 [Ganoderma sinense ZZ0214-1]|uniref:Uncharacterized protein n=1 Tax=Ganoderma sinense ZZ0214-1 TaxID=1077348 RepID=A0A2G8RV83_9APHY|nr:hypothetical protein GSI_13315 [Ganoderma sinense ZZ0214-1]